MHAKAALITAVSLLLVVPTAFSQDSVVVESNVFEVINNSEHALKYRCSPADEWAQPVAPGATRPDIACYSASLEFLASDSNPTVQHDCTGGTRRVTVTSANAGVIISWGSVSYTSDPWGWEYSSECVEAATE